MRMQAFRIIQWNFTNSVELPLDNIKNSRTDYD